MGLFMHYQKTCSFFSLVLAAWICCAVSCASHEGMSQEKKNVQDVQELLSEAVFAGDVVGLQKAIDAGASIFVADEWGRQPIHQASRCLWDWRECRCKEVLSLLIERGASVSAVDKTNDMQPIHYAAESGCAGGVSLLLEKGALARAPDRFDKEPIHLAVEGGCVDVVKVLLETDATIHVAHKDGLPLLHMAVQSYSLETVEMLLKAGADPYEKNMDGQIAIEHSMDDEMEKILRDAMDAWEKK